MKAVKKGAAPQQSMWRLYVVAFVLLCLAVLLVGRVLSLQILDTERGYAFLKSQGEMRSLRSAEIPAYRGVITDRNGEPLAVSTPVVSIWANPRHLAGSERLPELARALGMPLAELNERLARYEGKQFMYLQRHRVPHEAREILAKRFPGVYGEREYRRFYPAGEVAAQLVGDRGRVIASNSSNLSGRLSSAEGRRKPCETSVSLRARSPRYIPPICGTVMCDSSIMISAFFGR